MSDTKNIKYYDVEEIFKLNPNMKINVLEVDGLPLLIIDDLYLNPDLVRDVAINTPVPYTSKSELSGYPGRRGELARFIDCDEFYQTLTPILIEKLKLDLVLHDPDKILLSNQNTFLFNVFDSDQNLSNEHRYTPPHSDPGLVASVIYLNKDDEEPIGTGIYKHKHTGISFKANNELQMQWICKMLDTSFSEYYERTDKHMRLVEKEDHQGNHVLKGNENWELLAEASGRYNQMIAYVGGLYHSPMIDYNLFKDKEFKRINQVIFWNPYILEEKYKC